MQAVFITAIDVGKPEIEIEPEAESIDVDRVDVVIVSRYSLSGRIRHKYVISGDRVKILDENDREIGEISATSLRKWLKIVLESFRKGGLLDISFIW